MTRGVYTSTHNIYASEEARESAIEKMRIKRDGVSSDTLSAQISALERQREIRNEREKRSNAARGKALAEAKARAARSSKNIYAEARERGRPPGRKKMSALTFATARARERARKKNIVLAQVNDVQSVEHLENVSLLEATDRIPAPSNESVSNLSGATVNGMLPLVHSKSSSGVLQQNSRVPNNGSMPSQVLDVYLT